MNIKCNEKIAIHQGFGYISIGKFIGIGEMNGESCIIIRVKPGDNEGCSTRSDIFITFDRFKHNKDIFQMKEDGYDKWISELKEKVTRENKFHKWNTTVIKLNNRCGD